MRVRVRLLQMERERERLDGEVQALHGQLRAEQAVIEHFPDPIVLFRPGGGVERLNLAARRTLAADVPALLRHPMFRAALERAEAERQEQFADLSLPVPLARELHVSVLAPEEGGRLVAVLSDRTKERAVERMRADFVANVSHELRTPLTSLTAFIETLR